MDEKLQCEYLLIVDFILLLYLKKVSQYKRNLQLKLHVHTGAIFYYRTQIMISVPGIDIKRIDISNCVSSISRYCGRFRNYVHHNVCRNSSVAKMN